MKLNQLAGREGSRKNRMRVGRGIGSGKGKTAGRGTKGQKSRTGVAIKGFEGGQMPLHRRLPKRGFSNIFARRLNEVNLGRVQIAIDKGSLSASAPINAEALVKAGVLRRAHDGVRLLGKGEIKGKLNFEVDGASRSAVAAVEKAGGTVKVLRVKKPEPEKTEKKQPAKAEKKSGKDAGGEATA
jgi:large subunit ribosomal protein L15